MTIIDSGLLFGPPVA